ncbi:hypothetical protein DSO57_1039823 [Entomophthora muscae]|uniref:Uncharacterized protein n=1 Tax=Entomophthora muscae TaxID=34485 RepID=A0ACC2T412_9FUNG|nr:hypothetical protein DSO57_1039823 [Entomophthora muscae]
MLPSTFLWLPQLATLCGILPKVASLAFPGTLVVAWSITAPWLTNSAPPTAIIFLHGRCVDGLLHHRCCVLCSWWLGPFGASQSDLPSLVQLVFYVAQLPVGLGPNAGDTGSRAPAPGQQPLHDAHP